MGTRASLWEVVCEWPAIFGYWYCEMELMNTSFYLSILTCTFTEARPFLMLYLDLESSAGKTEQRTQGNIIPTPKKCTIGWG